MTTETTDILKDLKIDQLHQIAQALDMKTSEVYRKLFEYHRR